MGELIVNGGKNARVDYDNVGHGHERGEAREQFAPDGGVILAEMKDSLEQSVTPENACNYRYRKQQRQ